VIIVHPKYSSLNFSVGYRIYQRGVLFRTGGTEPAMSPAGFVINALLPWNWVSTFFHDKYARMNFDSIVIGSDIHIALASAIACARKGDERILIAPGSPNHMELGELRSELMKRRQSMDTENLRTAISELLSVESKDSITTMLLDEVEKINDDKHKIFLLGNCSISTDASLLSDSIGSSSVFFEDNKNQSDDEPGIDITTPDKGPLADIWEKAKDSIPVIETNEERRNLMPGILNGAYKSMIVVAKSIIKVSSVQNELGQNFASDPIMVGEARYPISEFVRFTPMHRMNDFHSVVLGITKPKKVTSEE